MAKLPCISLWQPWASALLCPELKVHETRHWPAPARLIGREFAIHAAARPAPADLDDEVITTMADRFGAHWRRSLPRGALIGTATLISCKRMGEGGARPAHINDASFGHWADGRYAWVVEKPTAFIEPIPWRGQQGWFSVELPA